MSSRRIGQILSNIVPLSDHDVEEILQEQKATRQRFGDAAISLGMARPQDVWEAWIQQMESAPATINLDTIGVDSQTAAELPPTMARRLGVVPVRMSQHDLLIASAQPLDEAALRTLTEHTGRNIVNAQAPQEQIRRALKNLYDCGSVSNAA